MSRIAATLAALLAAALLAGCESTPKVGVDFNPAFAFAGKTRVAVVRPPNAVVNDLTANRLSSAIELALEARGYQLVPANEAQLWFSFFVTTQNKTDIRTYNTAYSYGRCWSPACAAWASPQVDVKNYNEGTLMIDAIDPAARTLQWRGSTSKRLPSKPSTSERQKIVNEAVGAILGQFPPT